MLRFVIAAILAVPVLIGSVALYFYIQIPSQRKIKSCFTTQMNHVYLCPHYKDYTPLKDISPVFKQAVILSEDSLFYQHNGFDWQSIEKSFMENLSEGAFKRGGSTISQQLAKNM